MLAPQSGQTKLRIAEIKLELVFVTTTCEAIMPSLLWRFFTAECTEPSAGPPDAFCGGRSVNLALPPLFGFKRKSN